MIITLIMIQPKLQAGPAGGHDFDDDFDDNDDYNFYDNDDYNFDDNGDYNDDNNFDKN